MSLRLTRHRAGPYTSPLHGSKLPQTMKYFSLICRKLSLDSGLMM